MSVGYCIFIKRQDGLYNTGVAMSKTRLSKGRFDMSNLIDADISPLPWRIVKTTIEGCDYIEIRDASDEMVCFTEHTSEKDEKNFKLILNAIKKTS